MKNSQMKVFILFIVLVSFVIGISILSNQLWQSKSEEIVIPKSFIVNTEMTINQFSEENHITKEISLKIFKLSSENDLDKKLSQFGSEAEILSLVTKNMALIAEHASKNWRKIVVKFALWFGFLAFIFIYSKRNKLSSSYRNWMLFISLTIFGIIMGSDPSPMGTIKDAVFLFITAHVVFPPRLIALLIFLIIVILANKYICAWGCQAGTLQDLIFRINRKANHDSIIGKQVKLPFILTNSIRIIFFLLFIIIAIGWSVDIVEKIDLFKIFNISQLGVIGIGFVGIVMLLSLFIYRPWCHLICPFGLIGWLVEKISITRISVDYNSCIACHKCSDACPSTVMSAILHKNKKTIPDCFSCYSCREACPTGSIMFSSRKRTNPPINHFSKKTKKNKKNT